MITTPSVSSGSLSVGAPPAAVQSSPPAAVDFMGLLLLLMGVGIQPTPPQGSGGAPLPPPAAPSTAAAPVEDQAAEPGASAAAVEIDVPRPAVGQSWPVPLELYTPPAPPVVDGASGVTDARTPAADGEAVDLRAPHAGVQFVGGPSVAGTGPKRPPAEAAAIVAMPPAAASVQHTDDARDEPPDVPGVPPMPVREEHALALGFEATAVDPQPGAARPDGGRPEPAAAAPAASVPTAVLQGAADTTPVASPGPPPVNLAAPTVARPTPTMSSTEVPDGQTGEAARPASATRDTTAVRAIRPHVAGTRPAVEPVDHPDDRQRSSGSHTSMSRLLTDTPHVYAAHALPEAGAVRSVTPTTAAEAPVRPPAPPLVEQIVHTARLVVTEGMTQMDVQLEPPTLGTVRVSAAATADSIGLTLTAERPETRALLEQAIPQIQAALSGRGLPTASIAVTGTFDPPDARRAPFRRDADRGDRSGQHSRERHRPGDEPRPIGLVNVTV